MDVSISKKPGDDLGSFPMIFGNAQIFAVKKTPHHSWESSPIGPI